MDRRPACVRGLFTLLTGLSDLVTTLTRWNPGKFYFAPIHRRFGSSLRLLCSDGAKLDPQYCAHSWMYNTGRIRVDGNDAVLAFSPPRILKHNG
jgi:hypothetical protein